LKSSNWFYKNTGTAQNPSFSLNQTNFLQDQMIEVGDNSVPAFVDANGDGDYDMFIGQNFEQGYKTSIHYYENIGTQEAPSFQLITKDFRGLSIFNYYNIKPQFTDLNGDGKIDFLFSATNSINNQTQLHYILNNSQSGLDFSGQTITGIPFTFNFFENVHITDVNKDGIPDLLIGRSTGALEYWRNTGPIGSFNFVLEDGTYLNFGPSVLRQFSAIYTSDLDNDGKMDLLITGQLNMLSIISNYREPDIDIDDAVSEIIFDPFTNTYQAKNLGGRIWPTAVNLFGSDKPVIVVGNTLGGLHLLVNENSDPLPSTPQVIIYPVPMTNEEPLKVRADRPGYLQIVSTLGQRVTPFYSVPANQEVSINLPPLASGMYLAKIIFGKTTVTKRIIISK
jgi:hypothetical protein